MKAWIEEEIIDATDEYIAAVEEALTYIGAVLGITFIRVVETEVVVGDLRFGLANMPNQNLLGYSNLTGIFFGNLDEQLTENDSRGGDIFVNSNSHQYAYDLNNGREFCKKQFGSPNMMCEITYEKGRQVFLDFGMKEVGTNVDPAGRMNWVFVYEE